MWTTIIIGALIGLVAGILLAAMLKQQNMYFLAIIGAAIGALSPVFLANSSGGGGGAIVTIQSADQFQQQVIESQSPVLVDFYADWCPPCKLLAPTLESLAGEYAGRVNFVKIDTDKSPALAGISGFSRYPL